MQTIVIATHNAHKAAEIAAILSVPGVEFLPLSAFGETAEPVEDGTTFAQNAEIKAKAAYAATGLPALADDSGICVDALGGRPGIYSARYAGEPTDDAANNAKLLAELGDRPLSQRGAHFHADICYIDAQGNITHTEGRMDGAIDFQVHGVHGFGYDPLFLLDDYECKLTSAELAPEEKNRISHRARALLALRPQLLKEYAA
jgi:XTP/dITP diphosphohydrolase